MSNAAVIRGIGSVNRIDNGKVQIGLSEERAKELFEAQFGVDQQSRTPKQWENLVATYGMDKVIELEKMSRGQIKRKMK